MPDPNHRYTESGEAEWMEEYGTGMYCMRHGIYFTAEGSCNRCDDEHEMANQCPECYGKGCEFCDDSGYNPYYEESYLWICYQVDIGVYCKHGNLRDECWVACQTDTGIPAGDIPF